MNPMKPLRNPRPGDKPLSDSMRSEGGKSSLVSTKGVLRMLNEGDQVLKAARRILALLDEGRAKTGLSRHNFYTQALRVWDATLHLADMDEFLNVACVGVEKAIDQISRAFSELLLQASRNYYDVLGLVYMLAELGGPGQEYTPFDLVRLLVRVSMEDYPWPEPGSAPIKIYDPCCGSGSLLLGAAEYISEIHPDLLETGTAQFYGQEISYDGWLMARINMHLHGLNRAIRLTETLTESERRAVEQVMGGPPLFQTMLPLFQEAGKEGEPRRERQSTRVRSTHRKKQPMRELGPLYATSEPLFNPNPLETNEY
jgi:hypothetical protein